MDLKSLQLVNQFKKCKQHTAQLDKAVIAKYFPDKDFETRRDLFFNVDIQDIESFYHIDYPFRGDVLFDEKRFVEYVQVIPEFIVSLIWLGMDKIVTLGEYQVYHGESKTVLSLASLRNASEIVFDA